MGSELKEEERERAYIDGSRAAWRSILGQAIREPHGEPGSDSAEIRLAQAVSQLEGTRAALRRICAEHGDLDWDDDLHLADVIDKHLAPHLESDDDGE